MVQAVEEGGLTLDANPVGCLTCHERVARLRGICTRCHTRHRKAVRVGNTTWAALVAAHSAMPAPALPLLGILQPFAGGAASTSTVACGRNVDRCGQRIRCRR